MIRRTLAIMYKEFLHIVRDPRTLVLIFLIPVVQMVLLGYAATTDVEDIGLAVLDGSRTAASRALVRNFEATRYFNITDYVDSEDEAGYLLDSGRVRAALIIPTGYGREGQSGQAEPVGVLIDGSDPAVAGDVLASVLQTGQAADSPVRILTTAGLPGVEVRPTVWYNPGLESVNYMIPALMGLILQFLATFVTSMAIVREREYNTMEQLVVTPIKPAELVLGKTVPYVLLSLFDLVEVLIIGILWFGVPIHGSLMLLLALSALFLLGSLGIGILISTVSSTQQEAMLLSFLILLPSIFLSGFFFPLEAMPWVLQALSYLVPLRYMLIIMRGIVLKGVGMTILHSEVIFLTIFSVLTLVVAARRFRKSLD